MAHKIGWLNRPGATGETWSPITGCTKISEGCTRCYAERMSKRLAGRFGYPEDEPFRVTLHEDKLDAPLRWKKPRTVFVCSMSDLFHKDVSSGNIRRVFDMMARTPQHTYLILTKRPFRMKMFFVNNSDVSGYLHTWETRKAKLPIPNIWLGVTAENQRRADERIPLLLQCPAAVRFVSIEPMLGAVDLTAVRYGGDRHYYLDVLRGRYSSNRRTIDGNIFAHGMCSLSTLDWVICGGETGPGARPMKLRDVRVVRDQCRRGRVPFFFKQVGMWAQEFVPTAREWAIYSPVAGGWNYIRDRLCAEQDARCGFTMWSRMPSKAPIPDDLMVREWPGGAE